jgi:hypothetical protein
MEPQNTETTQTRKSPETLNENLQEIDETLWSIRDALDDRAESERRRGFWLGGLAGAAAGLLVWPIGHAVLRWIASAIVYLIEKGASAFGVPALTFAEILGTVAASVLLIWAGTKYKKIVNWLKDNINDDDEDDNDEG